MYLIAGIRVVTDNDGNNTLAGYHFSTGYNANTGKFQPVIPIGEKGNQENVASTSLIFVDLPERMDKEAAHEYIAKHPRFAQYRELIENTPVRETNTNASLKAKIKLLEEQVEKARGNRVEEALT